MTNYPSIRQSAVACAFFATFAAVAVVFPWLILTVALDAAYASAPAPRYSLEILTAGIILTWVVSVGVWLGDRSSRARRAGALGSAAGMVVLALEIVYLYFR